MPIKKVRLARLETELAELEQSFQVVSVTTLDMEEAEIVYETCGNRAAGDVETRA